MEAILEAILGILLFPIKPILEPIIDMGLAFVKLGGLIIEVLKAVPKIIEILFLLADPEKLIKDIIFAISSGIYMILEAVVDMMFGDMRKAMGQDTPQGSNEGGTSKDQKCISPSMTQILLLVLCPPLAVLLDQGILGIAYVLICSILTYFFYFPGLIYGSLYVL